MNENSMTPPPPPHITPPPHEPMHEAAQKVGRGYRPRKGEQLFRLKYGCYVWILCAMLVLALCMALGEYETNPDWLDYLGLAVIWLFIGSVTLALIAILIETLRYPTGMIIGPGYVRTRLADPREKADNNKDKRLHTLPLWAMSPVRECKIGKDRAFISVLDPGYTPPQDDMPVVRYGENLAVVLPLDIFKDSHEHIISCLDRAIAEAHRK